MRVILTTEARCEQLPDGSVWSSVPYSFWCPYLEAFEEVNLVARVRRTTLKSPGLVRSDGNGVNFAPVPYYRGPGGYLKKYPHIKNSTRRAVGTEDAIILRVPSQLATCVHGGLPKGRPYAVQVVGDPFDVFASGVVTHPLRPLFRMVATRNQKRQCHAAVAAAYVTQHTLQVRYPCDGRLWAFSDAVAVYGERPQCDDSGVAGPGPRVRRPCREVSLPKKLVCVGSLEQLYKGPGVILEALQICRSRGLDYSLTWVGGGLFCERMIAKAASLGLADRVDFVGAVQPGQAVTHYLDTSDLFVLPSRTEGLPRALIEAMARGLPCVASRVGGISELLHPDDLVPPGEALALAEKLEAVLSDDVRLREMSRRNIQTALEFDVERIHQLRMAFLTYVRDATKAWLEGR